MGSPAEKVPQHKKKPLVTEPSRLLHGFGRGGTEIQKKKRGSMLGQSGPARGGYGGGSPPVTWGMR